MKSLDNSNYPEHEVGNFLSWVDKVSDDEFDFNQSYMLHKGNMK